MSELQVFNFHDAIELAKRGELIARQAWDKDDGIIFWRPEDSIPKSIIDNNKSIPVK